MNIKKLITAGIMALAALATFADPTVTDVVAKQRYPWNGLVDITCKVTGIDGTTKKFWFTAAAVMPDTGNVRNVSHFWVVQNGTNSTDLAVRVNGAYRLLWDAKADLGQVAYDNMVVRVNLDAHDSVQLWEGGPYWATTNIGAENPEDYGYYFWWGDTVGYTRSGGTWNSSYSRYSGVTWVSSAGQQMSSSPFSSSSSSYPTSYKDNSALRSAGYIDSTGNLVPEHDAAHVHWGGEWRMPTEAELSALINNCTTKWITTNGVSGRLVTGKGAYVNRSIFLPTAGYGFDSDLCYPGSDGYYWSSTPDSGYSNGAWNLDCGSHNFRRIGVYRYFGQSVRPVRGFAQ